MAPPKKYATEEQRRAARLASKAKYNARVRGTTPKPRKSKPQGWVKHVANIIEPAPKKEEPANAQDPIEDGPELPGVSLPGFGTSGSEPEPGVSGGGDADSAGPGATVRPEGNDKSSGDSDRGSKKERGKQVDNGQVVAALAGLYCSALKMGSDYAQANGAMGLPDEAILINHQCMTLILEKQLERTQIDEEEAAAYICIGSSAWVIGNDVLAFKKKNPKKSNQPNGVTADAPAEGSATPHASGTPNSPQREHVNGKPPSEPATGLIVRNVGEPKGQGGLYK